MNGCFVRMARDSRMGSIFPLQYAKSVHFHFCSTTQVVRPRSSHRKARARTAGWIAPWANSSIQESKVAERAHCDRTSAAGPAVVSMIIDLSARETGSSETIAVTTLRSPGSIRPQVRQLANKLQRTVATSCGAEFDASSGRISRAALLTSGTQSFKRLSARARKNALGAGPAVTRGAASLLRPS
jgi:hypothetical protein